LTSLPVTSAQEAYEVIECYTPRLRVEDFFRVLKMGLVETNLLLQDTEYLQEHVEIMSPIAWRLMLLVGARSTRSAGRDDIYRNRTVLSETPGLANIGFQFLPDYMRRS